MAAKVGGSAGVTSSEDITFTDDPNKWEEQEKEVEVTTNPDEDGQLQEKAISTRFSTFYHRTTAHGIPNWLMSRGNLLLVLSCSF